MKNPETVVFLEISLASSNPLLPSSGIEALHATKRLGMRCVVLSQNPKGYGPLHNEVDEWVECDTSNELAVMTAANKFSPSALLSFSDLFTGIANQAARRLGLKSVSDPLSPAIARDKSFVREALDRANVSSLNWASLSLDVEISTSPIGYPCIVKPVDGSASWDVRKAANDVELMEALDMQRTRQTYGIGIRPKRKVLFEEELEGPLYSIEGFVDKGEISIWGYHDRILLAPPYYCEAGETFFSAPPDHRLPQFCKQVIQATGFDFGPFHLEVILTKEGPKVVELNPRLIGAGAHRCIDYACETNIVEIILRRYLEMQFEKVSRKKFSTLLSIFPAKTGIFRGIQNLDAVKNRPGIKEIILTKKPGDSLSRPVSNSDKMGYLISIGNSYTHSLENAKKAYNKLLIEIDEADKISSI